MTIEEQIAELVEPILTSMGLILYDVDISQERKARVLRILVDRPGGHLPGKGVKVNELAEANREIGAVLDIEEPLPGAYRLNVESPGIERSLRKMSHYEAVIGSEIHVVPSIPHEGLSSIDGVLKSAKDATIELENKDGVFTLGIDEIKRANTVFSWKTGKKK